MGRLFWKFFFFVYLAQVAAVVGVSAIFWVGRQQEAARWEAARAAGAEEAPARRAEPGPKPDFRHGPPGRHEGRPPPRGHPHGLRLPLEPLVAALLVSIVLAALLAWYFSKPIRSLRSAFDAAAGGDLKARVGAAMGGRRDELADLGRDFDRMASQLQLLVEGQRNLLHDVSHELRSPLARLQAAIGLARQQPAKLEPSLERIERESQRMDRLLGELLALSRLEAGATGPAEAIEMAELVAGIVDDARFEGGAKGVAVEWTGDCEAIVMGDGELLQRAIENVVRNAVKHAPQGSTVTVASRMDLAAGQLRLAVEDRGPGVAEEELTAIFQPFFRGAGARDTAGHGLGLAIARRVVERLGGRIGAANRPEGGLCVDILLPARAPA